MELAKSREELSPDHVRAGNDEALTPSTQDDDCLRRLLYAESPEFDRDIATTHLIVKEQLKLANEAIEKLQGEVKQRNNEASRNKEKYDRLKRRHCTLRDDVEKWRVLAQKKVCVLCNLARSVPPVPQIGTLPDGASSSPAVDDVSTAITPMPARGWPTYEAREQWLRLHNIDL